MVWVTIVVALAAFAAVGLGWSEHVAAAGTVVAANVRYAGMPVEGMPADEVESLVADRAIDLLSRNLTLVVDGQEVSVPISELGFKYDSEDTTEAIVAARHSGQPWDQFAAWVAGPLVEQSVGETWSFDPELATATLASLQGLRPKPAVEPRLSSEGSEAVEVVPGQMGTIVDIESLVRALGRMNLLDPPQELETELIDEPPTIPDDNAQGTADEVNEMTRAGALVSIQGHSRLISAKELRDRLIVTANGEGFETVFNQVSLQALLEDKFPQPVSDFKDPVFDVDDGQVQVVTPGVPYQICCEADAAQQVAQGVLGGSAGPFELTAKTDDDPMIEAWANGSMIVEPVGTFTTKHSCCEARVNNIHRMADLVRGVYLLPGETFSMNEFVGPRTKANGFVFAHAIRQGHLVDEVGGGVSQFVTTTFNAAYFAGLDFDEYRSHTLYFSRYPFGREATLGIPHPDLILRNTTGYPILMWNSYSGTTLTVTIYSTKHIEVEELGQRTSKAGACTHVETDRQRTYPDGKVVVDTIVADYRPGEGLDCAGQPTPDPSAD